MTTVASVTWPLVDDGALRGGFRALAGELRPRPGRFGDTIRLVALVLASVTISETFRIPEAALSAYIVLFVSRGERASTVKTAVGVGFTAILAIFVTILAFAVSLSEPMLRFPLIAIITFAAMFFSRISKLGPLGFAAGFIMAYGLTLGDEVLGLSLQSAEVSNTVGIGVPELLFIPPEEALLHFLLWLALAVAMPITLVVVGNLLTGRRPVVLLRATLATRLAACGDFCAGTPGAERALIAAAREGSAGPSALLALSHQSFPDYAGLIRETERLELALLAWRLIAAPDERQLALSPCVEGLRGAERMLRDVPGSASVSMIAPVATTPAARPLATEIARALDAIAHAQTSPAAMPGSGKHSEAGGLISAEALHNPDNVRFALKVTLAVMLCYVVQSLLSWPEIHTCVVTCFFVSLGTIGESVHKATLRVSGALIGGMLGIGTILLLMPYMVDLGDLLLPIAAVTLLAGWVACGSPRISYAGWQIGLAYYLTVLQGFGPTLDMQTARDRIIGIVLGNVIVGVVFLTVWPVALGSAVRRQVASAINQLAKLMRLDTITADNRFALQIGFGAATTSARGLMANTGSERAAHAPHSIDTNTVAALERVMVIVSVILNLQLDPIWTSAPTTVQQITLSYHKAIADWFERCAGWVRTGAGGQGLAEAIPPPPVLGDGPDVAVSAAWHRILYAELQTIMDQIVPSTYQRSER